MMLIVRDGRCRCSCLRPPGLCCHAGGVDLGAIAGQRKHGETISNFLTNTTCNNIDFTRSMFGSTATDLLATTAGARALLEYDEEILTRSNAHLRCFSPCCV
jgi:hypothetical protein